MLRRSGLESHYRRAVVRHCQNILILLYCKLMMLFCVLNALHSLQQVFLNLLANGTVKRGAK